MNCIEFRNARFADPYDKREALIEHRTTCVACRRFERDLHVLDGNLREAFKVAVPEGIAARVLLNQSLQTEPRRPTRWYWLSMAASFLIAAFLGIQATNTVAIDAELVAHIETEAQAVHSKHGAVSEPRVRQVLNSIDVDGNSNFGKVIFASTCILDGELIAHFVIEEAGQQYTVMLIPSSRVDEEMAFGTHRWRGLISPHKLGSIAVVGNDMVDDGAIRMISGRFERSVRPIGV